MFLFEIKTGHFGNSFERTYVWAESEDRAVQLFNITFPSRRVSDIECLLSSADTEFITGLDDEGFSERVK